MFNPFVTLLDHLIDQCGLIDPNYEMIVQMRLTLIELYDARKVN